MIFYFFKIKNNFFFDVLKNIYVIIVNIAKFDKMLIDYVVNICITLINYKSLLAKKKKSYLSRIDFDFGSYILIIIFNSFLIGRC